MTGCRTSVSADRRFPTQQRDVTARPSRLVFAGRYGWWRSGRAATTAQPQRDERRDHGHGRRGARLGAARAVGTVSTISTGSTVGTVSTGSTVDTISTVSTGSAIKAISAVGTGSAIKAISAVGTGSAIKAISTVSTGSAIKAISAVGTVSTVSTIGTGRSVADGGRFVDLGGIQHAVAWRCAIAHHGLEEIVLARVGTEGGTVAVIEGGAVGVCVGFGVAKPWTERER